MPRYQYIQCKNNQVMKESEVPGNPVLKMLDSMNVISSSINNNQNKAATHGQRKEKSRHCIPLSPTQQNRIQSIISKSVEVTVNQIENTVFLYCIRLDIHIFR